MLENNKDEEVEKGDIYNIPHKDLSDREVVIEVNNLQKSYDLQGNEDFVVALQNLTMSPGHEL